MDIRIKNRFGEMIYLSAYNGTIRLITAGKIYSWNPDADGYIGAIEHGGNILDGTEYRRPARGGGAWECLAIAAGTENHIYTERLYCQNHIPTHAEAAEMMEHGTLKYEPWECETPNPEPGENNEWIPA